MKILFFCGAAEPGNDGVGDYSRQLCAELVRLGHAVQLVALCDFHIHSVATEKQKSGNVDITAHRIPADVTKKDVFEITQNIVTSFEPDWISLQFVPYSFNPKGLPFWLPTSLKKLKGKHQWHFMMHELWLGIDKEASIPHQFIGKLQQYIVKTTISRIHPAVVTTQSQLYQLMLKCHSIEASILPIFSNIPLTAIKEEQINYLQIVLFGTIHVGAPLHDFFDDIVKMKQSFSKPIKVVFIGLNGPELNNVLPVLDHYRIVYEVMGKQSEEVISQVLVNSEFGISTTPYFQTEKSGIFAAYKEHNLKSISVAREWTPRIALQLHPHIIKYEKNNLNLTPTVGNAFNLNAIANEFVKLIS
ncbi:hypothetical protein [Flavobacterium sp. 7A]|uniref:hypothetical protein n=1 Tax=Flavobacterium sp. 7A TaxID=2940571 RepID=UPI0022262DC9|nr:hypothetical protein [Flavobacterium sp. 7A]MCW2118496.1 hypothetical protein [Flavobacterium sp. 7A]